MSQHAPTPGTGAPTGPDPLTGAPVDQPLDALVDGLVVVSATGLVLQANRAARESYGLQPFRSLPGALAHRWLEAQRAAHGERLVADVLLPLDAGQVVVSVSATRLAAAGRTVLVLRFFEDLTEQQTGDVLGVTRGTVKSTTRQALDRLRRTAPHLAELVEEGRLRAAEVDEWSDPAFLHPGAVRPRSVTARALLSPFDPVVWFRPRAERLFGFRYRIEIYVPEPKRKYGYYVLPFLLGEEIVARVEVTSVREDKPICMLATTIVDGSGEVCLQGTAMTYTVPLA